MDQISATGQSTTLIHFVHKRVNSEFPENGGKWSIACMPNMSESEFGQTPYHPPVIRSDMTQTVTCPACKKTDIFVQRKKIGG